LPENMFYSGKDEKIKRTVGCLALFRHLLYVLPPFLDAQLQTYLAAHMFFPASMISRAFRD